MSMILILKRVSDADIARLRAHPESLRTFLKGQPKDRGPEYTQALKDMEKQMAAQGWKPPQMLSLPNGDEYPFDESCDMNKMWQAIYFMLTGSTQVGVGPATILLHGAPISNEDMGYGPAMAISAAETAVLSIYLDTLLRKHLEARFNGPAMRAADIYPDIWDEDADDLKAELGDAYDILKAYCAKLAAHKLGMISYIS